MWERVHLVHAVRVGVWPLSGSRRNEKYALFTPEDPPGAVPGEGSTEKTSPVSGGITDVWGVLGTVEVIVNSPGCGVCDGNRASSLPVHAKPDLCLRGDLSSESRPAASLQDPLR